MSHLDTTTSAAHTGGMTTEEEWRLTRARQRYETIGMSAQRLGYEQATLKRTFQRLGIAPDDHLDARTPVYLVANVDKMLANRPGRGARGLARKRRGAQDPLQDSKKG
jgi:hypothetical protein